MDTVLIKTFLNVLAADSFVAAAERMFVTQSAISIRIQRLEDTLGQKLFTRSKSGVEPTVYGMKFEQYARSLLQVWDEAIYEVALPDGFDGSLSLGCEDALWPELSVNWLTDITRAMPTTAFSFQISTPANLSNMLLRGVLDIAVLYNPEIRQGFKVEHIMDDRLILVAGHEHHQGVASADYVYTNWGPEFAIAHSRWYPDHRPPQLVMQIGADMPQFLIEHRKAAFLPYRIADDYVDAGQLFIVKDSPSFPFPAYAVWTENAPRNIRETALQHLRQAAAAAPWIDL